MCGFAPGPDKAYVYDWTLGAQQLFDEILGDPRIEICGQNILYFDLPFAEAKGSKGVTPELWRSRVFDTMVAFHLCNSSYGQTSISSQNKGAYQGARGAEKDLAFIASNHTDMEYWKGRENYRDDIYTVCGKDVIGTDRAAYDPANGLKMELAKYGMTDLYYKHVLPVHLPLLRMTQRGMKINQEKAEFWMIGLNARADALETTLKDGLGDPYLNLDSPQQLMALLYDKLGLPVQYLMDKKKGQRRTANADAIEALAAMSPDNAALGAIVEIRNLRKMSSTFVRKGWEEGWLHPRFGVSKAANGRFNSQDPNAQNVPEEMREIWEPDDDEHILLSGDSSQIEWRVAMVLSGDPVGLELLASGVDNHRAVAAETLGRQYTKESLDSIVTDAERHAAKFIVYGLGYGRGADSIAAGHNLDYDFVREFIYKFFTKFAVFHDWREGLPDFVNKNHYLANPFARRRWWFTREITEIYNFPASSTAADMMIDEVIQLEDQLPKGATLRLTVHDEVVINTPKDIAKETWICVRDIMEQKWPGIVQASARPENVRKYYPAGWFCPVDIHVGTNWAMTKSKNAEMKAARAVLEKHLGLK
jgi:DNA polymerase I-like protein with 3'-5' exonuclease and polymerase domains